MKVWTYAILVVCPSIFAIRSKQICIIVLIHLVISKEVFVIGTGVVVARCRALMAGAGTARASDGLLIGVRHGDCTL